MQATNTRPRFEATADGHGICSHAGVVVLAELADRLGLTQELGRRANCGLTRPGGGHAHDRGAVLRDLVVMLADGGDCVSDLAGLRDQAGLFGGVCPTATAWRVLGQVAADPRGVAALWSALARVRARAWAAGAAPAGRCASTLTPPWWTPIRTSRARLARSSMAWVSPAAGVAGPWRWDRGGAGGDLAAGQRRRQHRPRPPCCAGDGAAGTARAGPRRADPGPG